MTPILWLSLSILAYTYIGYPTVMVILAKVRRSHVEKSENSNFSDGKVSILIALHNESDRAASRLRNLLDSDFPPDQLEVVAISDGSTDGTSETIATFAAANANVVPIIITERSGKPASINRAAARAKGNILVFADARQQFRRDTIPNLVANFYDPNIGAASGELLIAKSDTGAGSGVDLYWRLEKMVRSAESQTGSAIGCTGAVYAIRRNLFEPIPEDTLIDDVVIPMRIIHKGFRVIFDPTAVAIDPQRLDTSNESRRKARTLAGNFQMFFRYPSWLLPWRNRSWWRVLSHKYLRLLAPAFLVSAFVSSAVLTWREPASPSATILFWLQCCLYALALFGLALPQVRCRILTVPSAFLFLNIMVIRGLLYYLAHFGRRRPGW